MRNDLADIAWLLSVVDIVLAVSLIEGCWLLLRRPRTPHRFTPTP